MQQQGRADSDGIAFDRRDHRLGQSGENAQEVDARHGRCVLQQAEVRQIVSSREVLALTAQHYDSDGVVLVSRQQCRPQLRVGRHVQRITPLGAVDGDLTDPIRRLHDQDSAAHQDSPTTGITAPWMALARSEARKVITSASWRVDTHLLASASGMSPRFAGVSMMLGATAFTLIPRSRSSWAMDSVIRATTLLDAQ
ncbi:hypothetical protein D3C78_1298490 [compost metagenome]